MRTRFRLALLLAACTLATTAVIHAAVTTVTFTTDDPGAWGDGVAQDGDGGSANVSGITLQISMISDTAGAALGDALNFDSFSFPCRACYACAVSQTNFGASGRQRMALLARFRRRTRTAC